jgi:hypothetical protein
LNGGTSFDEAQANAALSNATSTDRGDGHVPLLGFLALIRHLVLEIVHGGGVCVGRDRAVSDLLVSLFAKIAVGHDPAWKNSDSQ